MLFESLVGLRPGISKLSSVYSLFGAPEVSKTSDGGIFYKFASLGIWIVVESCHLNDPDPVVDEVLLTSPCTFSLPFGVHIGQQKEQALDLVRRHAYEVTDEYEDAVYFHPGPGEDLLASVEFKQEVFVVGIELMSWPASTFLDQ